MQAFLFMWLCMVPMLLGIALAKKELMICDDEPADGSGDGELICMACEVDLNALLELKGEIARLHDQMLSMRQSAAASGPVQGEQQGNNTEDFLGLQDDMQNLRDYVHHWMSLQKQQQSDGGGGAAEGGPAGQHHDQQQQHTISLLLRMLESFRCTLLLTGFAVGFVMSIAMLQLVQK